MEHARIIIHLPHNTPGEASAVDSVISFLKEKRKLPMRKGKITGFTQTRSSPTAFEGWWWSKMRQKWIHDNLILIVIDSELRTNDSLFKTEVNDLKRVIDQFYIQEGSRQEKIWVVTHSVEYD